MRQGVANLFRPHNQTVTVTGALGLGVFLLGTLHLVQRSLLAQFSLDTQATRANIVVFDIQPDQLGGIVAAFRAHGEPAPAVTPIVPARLSRINGRTVDELLHDSAGPARNRWPLTREYRHTYRDTMVPTEVLTAGQWWNEKQRAKRQAARISLEEDIAAELKVGMGDRITWDVQGVEVETQVASLRRVDWARFTPNFFAVFEPGVLELVPQTYVTMAHLENARRRAVFQRDVVRAHPNVAVIDLAVIQQTLDRIVRSVSVAIRFMALFSLACGAVVLAGAVAASRYQRLREIVLLRTLGAQNRQIAQIVLTEYCALGALAAVVGAGLSVIAAWALTAFFFETAFHLPVRSVALLVTATITATAVIGLANSGGAVRQTPLAALRQLGE